MWRITLAKATDSCLPGVVVLLLTVGACGDDANGPESIGYDVEVVGSESSQAPDGTMVVFYVFAVSDEAGGRVVGATLRYDVSAGSLSSTTAISADAGLAGVDWTLTPEDQVGLETAELRACADDGVAGEVCTPITVATVNLVGD
jgi:hypothetical protein